MLYLTSDHGGFKLKQTIADYLKQNKIPFEDVGPHELVPTDDFPDYAILAGKKVAENPANRGIFICWTGQGMCIAANKIKGLRAIVGYSIDSAEWGRLHNDANVICLAGKVLSEDHANAIIQKFLDTNFENAERLVRRNEKINNLEK